MPAGFWVGEPPKGQARCSGTFSASASIFLLMPHQPKFVTCPTLSQGRRCYGGGLVVSRVWLFATSGTVAHQVICPLDFPGKSTRVGCHFLLHRIFLTQRLNSSLLHWQANSLPTEPPEKLQGVLYTGKYYKVWLIGSRQSDSQPPLFFPKSSPFVPVTSSLPGWNVALAGSPSQLSLCSPLI